MCSLSRRRVLCLPILLREAHGTDGSRSWTRTRFPSHGRQPLQRRWCEPSSGQVFTSRIHAEVHPLLTAFSGTRTGTPTTAAHQTAVRGLSAPHDTSALYEVVHRAGRIAGPVDGWSMADWIRNEDRELATRLVDIHDTWSVRVARGPAGRASQDRNEGAGHRGDGSGGEQTGPSDRDTPTVDLARDREDKEKRGQPASHGDDKDGN